MTVPLPNPVQPDQPETERNFAALAQQFPLGPNQTHHQIYPQARVYNSTDFTHNSTGNWLTPTFNSESWDYFPAGYTEQHSTSSNTSRLTCRVGGLYTIGGNAAWDSNTTGGRGIAIVVNGGMFLSTQIVSAAHGVTQQTVSTIWRLVPGDYVEVQLWQNSGANRTVSAITASSLHFWFGWLSP